MVRTSKGRQMTAVAEDRVINCFAKGKYTVPDILQILGSEAGYNSALNGCFRILSQEDGDKRVVWCRNVIAEIKAAKKMFMDLLSQGMVPYKVGVDGNATSQVMDEFDPTAEEIIFMPVKAIAGG